MEKLRIGRPSTPFARFDFAQILKNISSEELFDKVKILGSVGDYFPDFPELHFMDGIYLLV